ncbi:MAG: hypothetical protein V7704_08570 [Aurantimonas endophytica]|uniref:hypothetical protein n=1 Tax=Aurantimonas endophytica TaxID=1522175 RepID=UPI003002D127
MSMTRVKSFVKRGPLALPYIHLKYRLQGLRTQNDEAVVLKRLLARYDVPETFVEFGFSAWEFNCAPLAADWKGLLLDGGDYNVRVARAVLPDRITAKRLWITRENLAPVVRAFIDGEPLGILSIDVDGNDYWFLEDLIGLRPAIIIAEYNSSFGHRPVTVPYDPDFDRHRKHPSGKYYGASLAALCHLTARHGYALIEVGNSGINAFFVRRDLLTEDDLELSAPTAFREKSFPDGKRPSQIWQEIGHLPMVDVTTL